MGNFPNCVGAIDGKHIALQAPNNSESLFYNNYKGFHSIILLAACDDFYMFTHFDIGVYGSEGDAGVFQSSKFGKDIFSRIPDFPENTTVGDTKLPYFYVADDASPRTKHIQKSFSLKRRLKIDEIVFLSSEFFKKRVLQLKFLYFIFKTSLHVIKIFYFLFLSIRRFDKYIVFISRLLKD